MGEGCKRNRIKWEKKEKRIIKSERRYMSRNTRSIMYVDNRETGRKRIKG
jgi:hypothetical protein